jgi:signal transduction histidine kinase
VKNRLAFIILISWMFLISTASFSAATDTLEQQKDIARITVHTAAIGLAEAASGGGGFVEYHWVKPGIKGEHKKLATLNQSPIQNIL